MYCFTQCSTTRAYRFQRPLSDVFIFFFFLISNNFINEKRKQKGTPEVYMITEKELSTKRAKIEHVRHTVGMSYVEGRQPLE